MSAPVSDSLPNGGMVTSVRQEKRRKEFRETGGWVGSGRSGERLENKLFEDKSQE